MFWTDWNLAPFIMRCGMDGTNAKKIITDRTYLFWPNAIVPDYINQRIIWADAHIDIIA